MLLELPRPFLSPRVFAPLRIKEISVAGLVRICGLRREPDLYAMRSQGYYRLALLPFQRSNAVLSKSSLASRSIP